MSDNNTIHPEKVRSVLGKHILTDGMNMVLDLKESKGAYLKDKVSGKNYLDFLDNYKKFLKFYFKVDTK